jgi:hypothetical protein
VEIFFKHLEDIVKDSNFVLIGCGKIVILGALVSSGSMESSVGVDKIHVKSIIGTFGGYVSCDEIYAWNSKLWKDFSTIWKIW